MFSKIVPIISEPRTYYNRIHLPFLHAGYDFEKLKQMPIKKAMANADAIIFSGIPHHTEIIDDAREKFQLKLILDCSQYWNIPATHPFYDEETQKHVVQKTLYLLQYVDAVIVPTKAMAEKVIRFNPKVFIIPDGVPFSDPHFDYNKQEGREGEVMFGLIGPALVMQDIAHMLPAIRSTTSLPVTMCGYRNPKPEERNVWDWMEWYCSNNGTNKGYIRRDAVGANREIEEFSHIDVLMLPADDIPFNAFKTQMPICQAGVKKKAVIASPVPAYTLNDPPITFCKTQSDWKRAVKMHRDRGYVAYMGERLHQWTYENHDLHDCNILRSQLIQSL